MQLAVDVGFDHQPGTSTSMCRMHNELKNGGNASFQNSSDQGGHGHDVYTVGNPGDEFKTMSLGFIERFE